MPEGDTIAYAANRIRPVLEGHVPEAITTPQRRHALDRWPQRLAGRSVTAVKTHGKHLFLAFEGELVLHSHLGMTGSWAVYGHGRRWRRSPARAWIVLRSQGHDIVEFDGPLLELVTEGRTRFDQRLAALGPDVLAERFDAERFLRTIRGDDQTRTLGDALLDQHNIAGIGNMWKAEGCWEASLDPWRRLAAVADSELMAIVEALAPRMSLSAREGPLAIKAQVYGRSGRPCLRCATTIAARGQGDANRTTYWCPGCQT
jgi:endonuclease VIII